MPRTTGVLPGNLCSWVPDLSSNISAYDHMVAKRKSPPLKSATLQNLPPEETAWLKVNVMGYKIGYTDFSAQPYIKH